MANINDYKVIAQKSKKYFDLLLKEFNLNSSLQDKDKNKERLGFYLFVLEYLTGKKDISDLTEIITDTDFNKIVFNKIFNDLGVDAINIDEDDKTIQLFNFKYRENFKSGKQSINETILSTKFINAILNKKSDELQDKIKTYANNIIEKLESNDVWKLKLYIVSNEDFEFTKNNDLNNLEDVYGLEVVSIGLNEISEFITLRPKSIDAELILDKEAIMTFSESNLVSSKSYIIRVPLSEVIRITCSDNELRKKYNIENVSELENAKLDFSVLFDNVRGFVTNSKFNNNILKTLENEPSRFFIYNNGLTLTAKDIEVEDTFGKLKMKIKLRSIQVLNGGQTLRTIHYFNESNKKNIEENLSKAQVSLRIFKVSSDHSLNNKIAEFTNSQNAISNIDLKSLRSEQLQIEQFLDENNIIYARKSGDIGLNSSKVYEYKISMDRLGQILFSLNGYPEKATNQKKNIFDKYYEDVFGKNNLDINKIPEYIKLYFEIKKKYEELRFSVSEQKIFYILYLNKNTKKSDINETIKKFEEVIKKFLTEKQLSEARKLIRNDFKDFLDKEFNINQQ